MVVSPTSSSPLRRIASTTRSPLSVVIPGNIVAPIRPDRGGTRTSASPEPLLTNSAGSWLRAYSSTRVCARLPRSRAIDFGWRAGSSRSPRRTTIAIVPARSGSPTSAKEKKPNRPTPASSADCETITFTGEPVSVRSDPACAPNASGSRSCEGDIRSRAAVTAITGRSAATDPLTLISAVSTATVSIISAIRRVRDAPAPAMSCCPAHAVTPVESSASLTTKSDAMKITVGSPNPPSAWSIVSTPVAQSDKATPNATTPMGSRSQAKTATVTARTTNVIVESLTRRSPGVRPQPDTLVTPAPPRSRA